MFDVAIIHNLDSYLIPNRQERFHLSLSIPKQIPTNRNQPTTLFRSPGWTGADARLWNAPAFVQTNFARLQEPRPTFRPIGNPSPSVVCGDEGDRTPDPLLAKQVLSQLSYVPDILVVGVLGFEPRTSALSELRSSQLSYTPGQMKKPNPLGSGSIHSVKLWLDRVTASR